MVYSLYSKMESETKPNNTTHKKAEKKASDSVKVAPIYLQLE